MASFSETAPEITAETPYSRGTFKWLFDHSSARNVLGKETVSSLIEAQEQGNDKLMQEYYERMRDLFLKERNTDLKQALREEKILADFETTTNEAGKKVKAQKEEYKHNVEKMDADLADSILDNLNNN